MIWVLCSVFNEAEHLVQTVPATLAALPTEARYVFIDGKYPEFPATDKLSVDPTAEFARAHGDYLAMPVDEVTKRSAGLAYIEQYATQEDWVLVLDADEVITSLRLPEMPTVGTVAFRRVSDGYQYPRARLFYFVPGLRFWQKHYDLCQFTQEGVKPIATLTEAVNGLADELCGTGIHYDTRRGLERERAKANYYGWLQEHERLGAVWSPSINPPSLKR